MADKSSTPDIPRHQPTAGLPADDRPGVRPAGAEPVTEGVIYLTPDGDGYILYASFPTTGLAAAC